MIGFLWLVSELGNFSLRNSMLILYRLGGISLRENNPTKAIEYLTSDGVEAENYQRTYVMRR